MNIEISIINDRLRAIDERLGGLERRMCRVFEILDSYQSKAPKNKTAESLPLKPAPSKTPIGRAVLSNRMKRMGLSVVMGGIDPDAGPFAKKEGVS